MNMRRIVAVATALFVLVACSRKAETEGDLMKSGLHALYTKNDPGTAVIKFRQVLEKNPTHYGATYQLATALDRAGRRGEAQPHWEKVLSMAQASHDEKTAAVARTRLGRTPQDPEGEWMKAGLAALYTRRDYATAAAQFSKVLEKHPDHYGATYQLATALDRAGKPAEARPLWEKMLKMADEAKDSKTAATVRARLAQRP
jgi:tetratricopeptide (TPR) repeat protein